MGNARSALAHPCRSALAVVAGSYRKEKFGLGLLAPEDEEPNAKVRVIHNVAAVDCLIWADKWLERYAPSELATVIHEDGTSAKPLIKQSVRFLRSPALLDGGGIDEPVRKQFNLPLRRIIDTVHFAEKADARPLQLADLVAFTCARDAGQGSPCARVSDHLETSALGTAAKHSRPHYSLGFGHLGGRTFLNARSNAFGSQSAKRGCCQQRNNKNKRFSGICEVDREEDREGAWLGREPISFSMPFSPAPASRQAVGGSPD
jgi:hypothetical protein